MDLNVSRRDLLRWAAALAPASRLLAWQDDPKFSTGINVVNVLATVRDKQGKIAKDLVQDDFSIEEDGRPQTIRYFAKQTDLPLTIGLLVDTSGSERREIPAERRASYTFFEQVLREDKDKAFVLHFDREVELLQDVTSSRRDLEDALHDLDSGQPQLNRRGSGQQQPPYGGGGQGGGQQGRGAGGTALYDAVMLASSELMRKQQGRKAAILLSDGEDNGSKVSLTSAIEAAQREDTLVYSIRFHDEDTGFSSPVGRGGRRGGLGIPFPGQSGGSQRPGGSRVDGKKILQQISSETGGSYFEVSSKETLDKIYSQIEEELRNQYSLGYTSDQTGGGYRKIHVAVKEKNLIVQTREGYYATRSSDAK